MKPIIISPPFGNYIERDWATSVKGTYTLDRRWGLLWKVLTTLRKTEDGWVNKIGLRNKGLRNVKHLELKEMVSVAGLTGGEWMHIIDHLSEAPPLWTELNASCPNVNIIYPADTNIFWMAVNQLPNVCVKIEPTTRGTNTIEEAYRAGVRTFHISNSYPTQRGGESGTRLKAHSLQLIDWIKRKYYDITIIGGGGIYTPQDVRDYHNAGVDHYSLSTIWFTPWKVQAVKEEIDAIIGNTNRPI